MTWFERLQEIGTMAKKQTLLLITCMSGSFISSFWILAKAKTKKPPKNKLHAGGVKISFRHFLPPNETQYILCYIR